ncbi:MAG: ABC transporter permease subunit [Lentisphaerae bacterium]|nr:MAG: ABC transporter permease subunit [Lentisphaerota bacterium]
MTMTRTQPGRLERFFGPLIWSRLRRFRKIRRAWWSLIILSTMFLLSLFAELIANRRPLILHFRGHTYFPVIRFYSSHTFLQDGLHTEADYKALVRSEAFRKTPGNWVLWPIIPYSPDEIEDAKSLQLPPEIRLNAVPAPLKIRVDLRKDLSVRRVYGLEKGEAPPAKLEDIIPAPPADLLAAIAQRFENRDAPEFRIQVQTRWGRLEAELPAYQQQDYPRKKFRISLSPAKNGGQREFALVYRDGQWLGKDKDLIRQLPAATRQQLDQAVQRLLREKEETRRIRIEIAGTVYDVWLRRYEINFPAPPIPGKHWLGLDSSGRDVLVLIIYAFRTNMLFALLLVAVSQTIGVILGAIQGYFGGFLDLTMQRFIEIWSSLPFLYIIILVGNIVGRSFLILLVIYSLFNWIGISYYMRAEFLRLRRQPFIEAARVMGLPTPAILFRHILPNALVPILTFTPFALVGAIGTLTALDYLGFGLPPLTPSWGTLLAQAQDYTYAWWLILFPSLALFITMLLGVFIGEGIRSAFDPKQYARMQ